MERGGAVRATGETKMNEMSSRSHAVFIVIAEQSETVYVDDRGQEMSPEDFQKFMHARGVRREQEMNRLEDHLRQTFKVGKLNLVDLAGSERVNLSGATGQRLEESKQINKSLSMLGFVISALTKTGDRAHIPYRNSKLTRMLEDSLGGNCKTTMMAMISPAFEAMMETISTLKFANRAKNIRNEARVNEDLDQKSLLRKYEQELKKLRAELEERSKNVVDKRRLLELEEQRRRAEADKIAAVKELEAKSQEFLREKEEKKKLEQRIAMLTSQVLRGERSTVPGMDGISMGDETADEGMKQQQEKLRQQYEFKLADLERERENIEEEKAQVDRYKQLLLKQRDIMIALTQRLVERDEQIMALQDELDAYDRHHKDMEEKLDEKTALLIKFQRISMEVSAMNPGKSEELQQALVAWSNDVQEHRQREQQQQPQTASSSSATTAIGSRSTGRAATGSSSNTAAAVSSTDISEDGDDGQHYDDDDIVVPPPPPPLASSTRSFGNSNHNSGSSSNAATPAEKQALQQKISQQEQHIQMLENRLAESNVHSTRIERLLQKEIDSFMRTLPSEAQRQSLRDPLRQIIAQTVAKLKDRQDGSMMAESSNIASNNNSGFTQQLERDLSSSKEENARLKRTMEEQQQQFSLQRQQLQQQLLLQGQSSRDAELQGKCDTLIKEREAVQTIMEHKIKVLVQSVAQAAGSLLSTLPPEAGSFPASQALTKDVSSLQRLVNASIAALRNAANNTPSDNHPKSSGSSVDGTPVVGSRTNSLSGNTTNGTSSRPLALSSTGSASNPPIPFPAMSNPSRSAAPFIPASAGAPAGASEGYLSSYQQLQQQQQQQQASQFRQPGQSLPEWD
jgi:kinesin family protein 3/17